MPEGMESELPPEEVSGEPTKTPEAIELQVPAKKEEDEEIPPKEGESFAEEVLGDSFKRGVEKAKDNSGVETDGQLVTSAKDVISVAQLAVGEVVRAIREDMGQGTKTETHTTSSEESPRTKPKEEPTPDLALKPDEDTEKSKEKERISEESSEEQNLH